MSSSCISHSNPDSWHLGLGIEGISSQSLCRSPNLTTEKHRVHRQTTALEADHTFPAAAGFSQAQNQQPHLRVWGNSEASSTLVDCQQGVYCVCTVVTHIVPFSLSSYHCGDFRQFSQPGSEKFLAENTSRAAEEKHPSPAAAIFPEASSLS